MLYVRVYTRNSVYLSGGEDQKLSDKYTGFTINNKMTNDPRREKEYYHCFETFTTERNKVGMIHVYQNKIIHYRRYNMYQLLLYTCLQDEMFYKIQSLECIPPRGEDINITCMACISLINITPK